MYEMIATVAKNSGKKVMKTLNGSETLLNMDQYAEN